MTDKPENPQAFPWNQHQNADGTWDQGGEQGMTLRDYAVINYSKAMMGNTEFFNYIVEDREPEDAADVLAKVATVFADAMLKARSK